MRIRWFFWGLLVASQTAFASPSGGGGRESPFWIGVGARGLGLGGASAAYPEDASAFTWNPAGMRMVQRQTLLLSQTTLFEGVQYHFIGYVIPTLGAGTYGVGVSRIGVGGIPRYEDVAGVPIYTGDFSYWWGKLSLAYALPLVGGLSLGINFEANRQVMGGLYATNGFGLDGGLLYCFPGSGVFEGLSVGYDRVHLVAPRFRLGTRGERLPALNRWGIAKRHAFREGRDTWSLLCDLDRMKGRKVRIHLGSEYAFDQTLFFRLGLDHGRLTAGAGLRYRFFQIDYATARIGDPAFFNRSHLFSLSLFFGKSLEEQRQALIAEREREVGERLEQRMAEERQRRIRDALQAGEEALKKNDFFNARLEFARVLREDPNNRRAQEFLALTETREQERERARQDSLLQKERQDLLSEQNRQFVNTRLKEGNEALRQGNIQKAIEKWKEALAVDPENPTLRRYLQQARQELEIQVGRTIARARILADQEKLSEARSLLEQARIQAAGETNLEARVNQEIKRLDQQVDYATNLQAGLDRYNRGEYEAAVPYLRRALEIRPDDERVLALYRNANARSAKETRPLTEEEKQVVRTRINEGLRLYRDGHYEEALRVWEEALKLDPNNVNLLQAIEGARQKLKTFEKPK